MNKLEVREAVEYALDKQAICEAIGYGYLLPHLRGRSGGRMGRRRDQGQARRTIRQKAKELLAAAGYADGCPIDLLAVVEAGGSNTAAEAIKGYLDAAGFVTNHRHRRSRPVLRVGLRHRAGRTWP